MQGAKLRDAVRSGALADVHAILKAAGPTNAFYLVQEVEPPRPKWDRLWSARGSKSSSEEGYTAVHLAAKMNHVPILDALLEACPCALNSEVERGYSDHQVKKGLTPIMVAARTGNADAVRELVSRRAALNDKLDNGNTTLLLAAAKGHSSALEALLQQVNSATVVDMADINARDHSGAVVPQMWLSEVTLLVLHGCCAGHGVLCSPVKPRPTLQHCSCVPPVLQRKKRERCTTHLKEHASCGERSELAVRPCSRARCLGA